MGQNVKRFPLPCGNHMKRTVQTQDLAGDLEFLKTFEWPGEFYRRSWRGGQGWLLLECWLSSKVASPL